MTDTFDSRGAVARILQGISDQMAAPHRPAAGPEEFIPDLRGPDEPDPPMPIEQAEQSIEGTEWQEPARQRGQSSSHAWGGHENGRIPTNLLADIGGGHRLETAAADAWKRMVSAAAADGIRLGITDSYRSYDAQVDVRRRKGDQVATATPGTSVHGWGHAVDANVNDPQTLAWLRANGPRFGWVNPEWAQREGKSYEPWHWEFQGG